MPRFAHVPTTNQADVTRNFEQLEGLLRQIEEHVASLESLKSGVTRGGKYTAFAAIAEGKEEEPSVTKLTFVSLQAVANTGKTSGVTVTVGGVIMAEYNFNTEPTTEWKAFPITFLVPPKTKWKWTGGAIKEVKVSYLQL
jgi:hypothetical protein